jgi:hypothetical protein
MADPPPLDVIMDADERTNRAKMTCVSAVGDGDRSLVDLPLTLSRLIFLVVLVSTDGLPHGQPSRTRQAGRASGLTVP